MYFVCIYQHCCMYIGVIFSIASCNISSCAYFTLFNEENLVFHCDLPAQSLREITDIYFPQCHWFKFTYKSLTKLLHTKAFVLHIKLFKVFAKHKLVYFQPCESSAWTLVSNDVLRHTSHNTKHVSLNLHRASQWALPLPDFTWFKDFIFSCERLLLPSDAL